MEREKVGEKKRREKVEKKRREKVGERRTIKYFETSETCACELYVILIPTLTHKTRKMTNLSNLYKYWN